MPSAQPVRVLWLIAGLARGGAEQLLVGTAQRLDPARVRVEVAHVLAGYDALGPRLSSLGIPVHSLGARSVTRAVWLRRLRRLLAAGAFDIVHTHSPAPAALARLTVGRDVAFVHTEHSSWRAHHPATRFLNAVTYRRNAAVLAVSRAVAATVRPLPSGGPAVEVVPQGIDHDGIRHGPDARRAARRALDLDEAAPVIGAVGNFSRAKGHETLLAAFARLAASDPDVRLVLLGFGPREERLRAQARAAGVAARVTFAGSRDDVGALLPSFDVFALPSRNEGRGLALLEAMAAGVPCVASRADAIPETLRHGEAGLLVATGDADALAQALRRLLDDAGLRAAMGEEGRRVAAHLTLEPAVARLSEIYEEVARGVARRAG